MAKKVNTALVMAALVLAGGLYGPAAARAHDDEAPAPGDDKSVEMGKALAEEKCSACHAVSGDGPSPNPKAPLFKNITKNYPAEHLQEAFAEGVVVGKHGAEMPAFELEPEQIDDLVAYLASVGKGSEEAAPAKTRHHSHHRKVQPEKP